jgi:hypothetical protein
LYLCNEVLAIWPPFEINVFNEPFCFLLWPPLER